MVPFNPLFLFFLRLRFSSAPERDESETRLYLFFYTRARALKLCPRDILYIIRARFYDMCNQ